jgi:hypothetical protein
MNKKFYEELIAYIPFILHGPHRKPKKIKGWGTHRHTNAKVMSYVHPQQKLWKTIHR